MNEIGEYIGEKQPLKIIIATNIQLTGCYKLECKLKNITSSKEFSFSGDKVSINSQDNTKVDVSIDGGILSSGIYIGQIFVYFDDKINPYVGELFTFRVKNKLTVDLVDKVKTEAFIGLTHNEHDIALYYLIEGILHCAIDFMDNKDIDSIEDIPNGLLYRLLKQVTYEYRRRKDLGLQSVNYKDGNIEKYTIDEWLPEVKEALLRYRKIVL